MSLKNRFKFNQCFMEKFRPSATPKLSQISKAGNLLTDKNKKDKERPWRMNKQTSELLSQVSSFLGENKRANRIGECGSYLLFLECIQDIAHPKKLKSAHFCKDRLCSACQWRRSLKEFAVALKIAHTALDENPTLRFLFLTLTVPNVSMEKLPEALTLITESWHRLSMRTEVKQAVKGFHRAIEITYNSKNNTYHPHVHVVLAVPSHYFKTSIYIKRDRWLELWRESTRIPRITQVDIRAIKNTSKDNMKLISAFAEACKYSVKEWSLSPKQIAKIQSGDLMIDFGIKGHIWIRDDLESSAEQVAELRPALYHRRLVQFGGIFRDIKRELKLQSAEESEGDLVHVRDQELGCQCKICSSDFVEHLYIWNKINRNYIG